MLDIVETNDRGGIQVIARAAAILRVLKDHPEGLSLGQIAERVGLPRSTVQRIIGALQMERLTMTAGAERGIRLGPELQSLADAARIDIVQIIHPYLQELARVTEETVDLAVLRGNRLIFVDQIQGAQRLRAVSSVGETFPLTTTANGKASLALLEEDTALKLASAELSQQNSAKSVAQLLKEIRAARKAGVAYDIDEHTLGISAVGVAFRQEQSGIYAITIPTPSTRFAVRKMELRDAILKLAARLSKVLADH